MTPEFASVLRFLAEHPDPAAWAAAVPGASDGGVPRLAPDAAPEVERCLAGSGRPAVIADALRGSSALATWTWERFASPELGGVAVRVNDRAPARHADRGPGGGGAQRTLSLSLREYVREHVAAAPASIDGYAGAATPPAAAPFYLNGWRAFVEAPALAAELPAPAAFAAVDNNRALLAAIDAQLFGSSDGAISGASSSWTEGVDRSLTKLFLSPPGATTRLHFDAGDAHGWLAQVTGRKLFVLLPPAAAAALRPLASEAEMQQSALDPLHPDLETHPEYTACAPLAVVLQPGEAVLIPRGWWHFAVALDRSVTLQKNFYHAQSNAAALVAVVLKTAAALKAARAGG